MDWQISFKTNQAILYFDDFSILTFCFSFEFRECLYLSLNFSQLLLNAHLSSVMLTCNIATISVMLTCNIATISVMLTCNIATISVMLTCNIATIPPPPTHSMLRQCHGKNIKRFTTLNW